MINHFLAIDLGASSGRAMLGRLDNGVLSLNEVHRFANSPVKVNGSLRWDAAALERNIRKGVELARVEAGELSGIGVDSWGVDYVLLDASGAALEPPFHYRDSRTDGVMQRVCQRLGGDASHGPTSQPPASSPNPSVGESAKTQADRGREKIYARTGIQFLPFNTIYQLAAHDPHRLHHATGLLMMADYFLHRLGGRPVCEITLASTSQLLDARSKRWALDLLKGLDLPADLMPELVEAGKVVGNYGGTELIATASHDTAAAVAGCPGEGDDWAFLSAGTWSLLGVELGEPVLTPAAMAANLGNESGVAGTTRLLGNVMGLWLLQECRRQWAQAGSNYDWDQLVDLAGAPSAKPFFAVIDPDDPSFIAPGDMPAKIAEFCRRTGQPVPDPAAPGQTARIVLEGVALKTRLVLRRLEAVSGRELRTIHMVGGGVNNRLLCQWTADATGRRVLAGPAEATAAGNVLTQAIGTGLIASLEAAREVLRHSISLDEYEPLSSKRWDAAAKKLDELLRSAP